MVVRKNGVNLAGNSLEHVLKELPGGAPAGFLDEPGPRERAGAVDTDEEIELAFGRRHLVCKPACKIDPHIGVIGVQK